MMKSALYYIFKKNAIILLILTVCFVGIKFGIVNSIGGGENQQQLDNWVLQCENKDQNQIEEFANKLSAELMTDSKADKSKLIQFSEFYKSFANAKEVNNLIDFAKNSEGTLPVKLPYDYMNRLDFYKQLNSPQVINEGYLDTYFELQQYSVVIFVAIFIVSFLLGKHYESEIYKYTLTTKNGKRYNTTLSGSVITICCLLLVVNEIFDLLYSGILNNRLLLNASVQSYSAFSYSQINAKIADVLWPVFFSKLFNLLIFCCITQFVAQKKKNVKDTIVLSFGILLMCFLINRALNGAAYSLFQIGIVDWKIAVKNSVLMLSNGISSLSLGSLVTFVLLFITVFFCFRKKIV